MEYDVRYALRLYGTGLWSSSEIVSSEGSGNSEKPQIGIDCDSNVHVVWQDSSNFGGSDSDIDIFYKKRIFNTAKWTRTEIVSKESSADSQYPSISIKGSFDIHFSWQDSTDYNGSGSDVDIFYKRKDLIKINLNLMLPLLAISPSQSNVPFWVIFPILGGIVILVNVIIIIHSKKKE